MSQGSPKHLAAVADSEMQLLAMKGTSCFALGRDGSCREISKYFSNKDFRNLNNEK